MSVQIIDSLPELGGQLTALYPEKYIYDMPGYTRVLAKDLVNEMVEQALQFDPDIYLSETAEKLDKIEGGYRITSANGATFDSKAIIVAAGIGAFSPTPLGVEGEQWWEGRGLHYGVKDPSIFSGRRVLVVGGGDSAMDWCLNLEPIAKGITLAHRRDSFRAHEDTVQRVHASSVKMKLFNVVKSFHGQHELEAVTLENTQTKEQEVFHVDDVIVNVGFKSSLGPLRDWGLEIKLNSIVTDSAGQTNLPGIYAVGDVCSFPNKLKLIATGVGEAATAVCLAKVHIDPESKLFPGHSSDKDL